MCCFFNDPATTEIYTLSLHDALPISSAVFLAELHRGSRREVGLDRDERDHRGRGRPVWVEQDAVPLRVEDRKSTRLNSSHLGISYAVFCLKKKKLTMPRCTACALTPD